MAVSLIAATQRPSQQAMGKGAVRSQMDIRIRLRVRERRDVDLILGQGAFNAGWHAHQLTQPGAFLISSPEHATPERHRAYLITDDQIARHAAQHAHARPHLVSGGPDASRMAPGSPRTAADDPADGQDTDGPEAALWAALLQAGPDGLPITDLMTACGMGRSWVYYRLREHARAGRAVQTTRGSWPAVRPGDGHPPGHPVTGRPPREPRQPRGDAQ